MIGFDKTITIYTQEVGDTVKEIVWIRTQIDGASWSSANRVIAEKGFRSADDYSVRILARNIPDNLHVKNGDIVMLGVGPEEIKSVIEITRQYSECFTVTAVHDSNVNTPLLPHLRLEGGGYGK